MRLIADTETDGLLDVLTKIHCLVLRDGDTGELVLNCADQEGYTPISEGLKLLEQAERIWFHNATFDVPALMKVYPALKLDRSKVVCTLKVAQMRWTNIKELDLERVKKGFPKELVGRHSLKSWGVRLGEFKGDYTGGWEKWSPEMSTYCVQDTLTTYALVQHIRKHGVSPEAVETEMEVAWYLAEQEKNGWPFDLEGAARLQAHLSARREDISTALVQQFGSWSRPKSRDDAGRPEVRTSTTRRHMKSEVLIKGKPAFVVTVEPGVQSTPLEWLTFNPGSRQHIADRLQKLYGWKPTSFTNGGQPEVNEKTLSGLPQDIPGVKLLMEFLLVEKRLGQLAEGKEAWIRHAKLNPETGLHHVHGRVLQSGTVTHRAAHINPNLAQVPKVGKPFGEECRSLFGVPKGWVQVGADASALEARCMGHYMAKYDDGAYGQFLLTGDVHTANRIALGLPDGKEYRDRSKQFKYAFDYGAGDEKLGSILDPKAPKAQWKSIGAAKRKQFLKAVPVLAQLLSSVKARTKQQGFLTLPDGRRVPVRSEHSALNSLLQGAGAVLCKRWLVHFNRRLTAELGPQGWKGKWAALGWIHDEVQLAVRPEYVEQVKAILVDEMRGLTQHFGWRTPLDGEAKHGATWSACH